MQACTAHNQQGHHTVDALAGSLLLRIFGGFPQGLLSSFTGRHADLSRPRAGQARIVPE